jgi:hypothetical protein
MVQIPAAALVFSVVSIFNAINVVISLKELIKFSGCLKYDANLMVRTNRS